MVWMTRIVEINDKHQSLTTLKFILYVLHMRKFNQAPPHISVSHQKKSNLGRYLRKLTSAMKDVVQKTVSYMHIFIFRLERLVLRDTLREDFYLVGGS